MKRPAKIAAFALGTIASLIIGAAALSPYGEFVSWQFDLIRGFKHTFPTESVWGHEVTLIQTPGMDFYDTYFLVKAPDGEITQLLVDGDDHRWKNPRTKTVGSRLYYIEGSGVITDQTSYIDKEQGVVYAGYLRQTLRLSAKGG